MINPRSQWTRFFDAASLSRGKAYMLDGRVASPEIEADGQWATITARVQGSLSKPYQVTIDAHLDTEGMIIELDADCACPMAFLCKHAAAVLYKITGLQEAHRQDELFPAPAPSPSPAVYLPREISRWMSILESASAQKPAGPAALQQLYYLINPVKKKLRVDLLAMDAGGIQRKTTSFNVVSGIGFFPEDVGVAQMLNSPQLGYRNELTGAYGAYALEMILRTGRAYFGKEGAVVSLGEARPARLVWELDRQGFQRPRARIDFAGEILPMEPLWYFDPEKSHCGPLDTGLSPELTRSFLAAPPVPPLQASQVDAALRTRMPGVALPMIQRMEIERLENVPVEPHLELFQIPNPDRRWMPEAPAEIPVARVRFNYAGNAVEPMARGLAIAKIEEGKIVEIARDLNAEAVAMTRFLRLGFIPVDEMFLYGNVRNANGLWTLGAHASDWIDFVTTDQPALVAEGWKITIEPSFKIEVAEPSEWYADAAEQGNDWFGVELGVMVDGKKINLLPVLAKYLARNPSALSLGDGDEARENIAIELPDKRILSIPADRLRSMSSVLAELFGGERLDKKGRLRMNKLRAADVPSLQETNWRWKGSDELKELGRKLRDFKGIAHVAPSPGLNAELRPYQQEGLNWLQFLREYNLGGVLADDMGLGKTIQALAHLLVEEGSGRMDVPSLVIAPTSLMTNWRQEAAKFAPTLRTLVLHGLDRKAHFESIKDYDLVVTSYALLPRDEAVLAKHEFHCVILDEAQYIKNPKTKYAQIAYALKARHRLCLTGTPMENHLGELWSLFNFALPGFLSDEARFRQAFRNPIEKRNDDGRRKMLAHRIAPFILRRRKEDVAKELPPKTEITQTAELEGSQRDLYETIRLAMHAKVREEVAKRGMSRSHIVILDALLKLRQVCCDPRLVPLELARKVKQSAKLELLMDLVPEMVAEGRRILIFSQFTSMLALIEEELEAEGIQYVLLTGDTNDRATPIARFQGREVPVFLISLKAGGTGLNLTAADTVIHYDPWWNPAVENQATDRAHRIGQEKQVFVYKLITAGTVEEKIVALQARKKALVAGLLDSEQAGKLELTAQDLDSLFSPLPNAPE